MNLRAILDAERADPADPDNARAICAASARIAEVWRALARLNRLQPCAVGTLRLAAIRRKGQPAHAQARTVVVQ